MKPRMRLIAATVLTTLAPLAFAQTAEVPPPAANAGQTLVATKIASNFVTLAGSQENALALVNALRNGTDVTLTTVVLPPEGSTEPPTTTTTTFTPPTGKMGWGNVKHSLALAQDALARAGVANPTAEQLQTALTGGDIVVTNADGTTTTTTLKGVLTMRAGGMGWGNIAKEGGTKLGPVTSKVKMGNPHTTPATASTSASSSMTTAAGAAAPPAGKSRGITTASGVSVGAGASKGITTASGATSSHGGGKGLVTAEGATAGHTPKGNAYGRGIVSASGAGATAGVTTAAGGNGNHAGGNGKGNGKGGGKPGG